jgi:hypothetical protein
MAEANVAPIRFEGANPMLRVADMSRSSICAKEIRVNRGLGCGSESKSSHFVRLPRIHFGPICGAGWHPARRFFTAAGGRLNNRAQVANLPHIQT